MLLRLRTATKRRIPCRELPKEGMLVILFWENVNVLLGLAFHFDCIPGNFLHYRHVNPCAHRECDMIRTIGLRNRKLNTSNTVWTLLLFVRRTWRTWIHTQPRRVWGSLRPVYPPIRAFLENGLTAPSTDHLWLEVLRFLALSDGSNINAKYCNTQYRKKCFFPVFNDHSIATSHSVRNSYSQ